jgi:hypothetical protein
MIMDASSAETAGQPFSDWHTDEHETFEFFGFAWNVAAARRILAAKLRPSHPIEVPDLKGIMRMMDIKPDKITKANLTVPLIVVKAGNWWLPIDGWHRIARAIKEGMGELPSVRLTNEEQKRIRMS